MTRGCEWVILSPGRVILAVKRDPYFKTVLSHLSLHGFGRLCVASTQQLRVSLLLRGHVGSKPPAILRDPSYPPGVDGVPLIAYLVNM